MTQGLLTNETELEIEVKDFSTETLLAIEETGFDGFVVEVCLFFTRSDVNWALIFCVGSVAVGSWTLATFFARWTSIGKKIRLFSVKKVKKNSRN